MGTLQHRGKISLWRDERGFTLPEVMIIIVIMGILFAIAASTWFGVVESRNVDSATNQGTADMRLAPGDVISTGTPGAVQILDGDVVECRISGFEPLSNPVSR